MFMRKWIHGECRHLCTMCKHKEKCWKELNMGYKMNKQQRVYGKGVTELSLLEQVKKLQEVKQQMKQEIERLHGIIQQLTRELDEAEEHAFCMQEKLSQLMEKERF